MTTEYRISRLKKMILDFHEEHNFKSHEGKIRFIQRYPEQGSRIQAQERELARLEKQIS